MTTPIDTTLRLRNDSAPHGEGWWEWSVWVEGSPADLAAVKSVTYRLHPTFPRPVVRIVDASTNFRLSSAGWGEFLIAADVQMRDGSRKRLERWLELGDPGASAGPSHRQPSVFLSYSVADSGIVRELSEALHKQGIDVRTAEEAAEGSEEPYPRIQRELGEADAVVGFFSDPPSHFVEREAMTALSKGRFVLPVVLGGASVTGELSQLPRYELSDVKNVAGLADSIAARVKDHVIPEEDE